MGFYGGKQRANVFYKHILKYFFNLCYKGGVQGQRAVYFGSSPSNYSVLLGVIGCYNMIYQIASECGVFSRLTAVQHTEESRAELCVSCSVRCSLQCYVTEAGTHH